MSGDTFLLSVRDLEVSYGGTRAVRGVSFAIRPGEILTLIGGNGAGKSTVLRAISGMIACKGVVEFDGRVLGRMTPDRVVAAGVAHVPEGRGIFGNLTVRENLALATWQRRDRKGMREDRDRVFGLFPRLAERIDQEAGTLSGGEQQMLAVGRALMTRARLLLLDEPSMGLSPVLVREIFSILREINRQGVTILLVEQNARMALRMATRACVLEAGVITLEGTGSELLVDRRVREAYLGG
ncbi:MAG: ABC transporter ATP-binding protein [bacterium]